MDIVNILANLTSKGQAANFLQEQQAFLTEVNTAKIVEDARYYNPATPFADAQKISDNYKQLKRRVPMTIEYYKRKPLNANDTDAIESIEMYINPSKLNITNQKLKSKAYTRAGIFYHQWGDDHPVMQLSGTVGLSGMRGIETLEKIYYNSGALLHYQDVGVTKIGGTNDKYEIINNNINDIAQKMVNGSVTKEQVLAALNEQQKNQTFSSDKVLDDVKKYLTNNIDTLKNNSSFNIFMSNTIGKLNVYYNQQLKDNLTTPSYQKLQEYVKVIVNTESTEPVKSMKEELKVQITKELVDSFLNQKSIVVEGVVGGLIDTISQKSAENISNYIQTVNDLNTRSTIDKSIAFKGWQDISDEVIDEWRPRVIFIYFEDRIYIGHFANFGYARTADSMLINYDMKFDIIRQIIVTSTASDKAPSVGTTGTQISLSDPTVTNKIYNSVDPVVLNLADFWQGDIYIFGDPKFNKSVNKVKIKILTLKEALTLNSSINQFITSNPSFPKTGTLSQNDVELIEDNLRILRFFANGVDGTDLQLSKTSIPDSDPLYGTKTLSSDQVLWFFALAKYNNITPGIDATNLYYNVSQDDRTYMQQQVRNLAYIELQRSQNVYNFLGSNNLLTPEKAAGIYEWIKKVRAASGIVDANPWEDEILTYVYGSTAILEIPTMSINEVGINYVKFKINPVTNATNWNAEIWQGQKMISQSSGTNGDLNTITQYGLNNNTQYELKYYVSDSTGSYRNSILSYSNFTTLALSAPLAPTTINITPGNGRNFNISFVKGQNATHTDIDFSLNNDTWDSIIEYPNQMGTSYNNISLPQYGTWYFRLRSKNKIDNFNETNSDWVKGNSITITNPNPVPPTVELLPPTNIEIKQIPLQAGVHITFNKASNAIETEIQATMVNNSNFWNMDVTSTTNTSCDKYLGYFGNYRFRLRSKKNNIYSEWVEYPSSWTQAYVTVIKPL